MKSPAIVSFLWESQLGVLREFFKRNGSITIVTLTPYVTQSLVELVKEVGGALFIMDRELSNTGAQNARAEWEALRQIYGQYLEKMLPAVLATEQSDTLANIIGSRLDAELPMLMTLLHGLDLAQQNYDLCLMVSNEDVMPMAKVAMHWARAQNIPSLHLSHALALNDPYTVHSQLVADIHAVYGQRGLEGYLDYGVPAERMRVTGNPAWDKFSKLANERATHEAELRKRHGLRDGEPIVVFGTTWASSLTAHGDERIFGQTVGQFIDACEALHDAGLSFNPVIKDRPPNFHFGERRFKELLVEHGADPHRYFYLIEDGPLWAACADVLVAVDSNYCVEALLCGTPAINLHHPANTLFGPCYDANSGVLDVEASELGEAVQRLLQDVSFRKWQQVKAASRAPYFNLGIDGMATARVAELMSEMSVGLVSRPSASLNYWLESRAPTPIQERLIENYVRGNSGGPTVCIFVLDLVGDSVGLMSTIKSLNAKDHICIELKIVALSVGGAADVLLSPDIHLVEVDKESYIDALNDQLAAATGFDWVMMVKAGEEFTSSGQLIAQLELVQTPDCRAISFDEIYRQDDALGAACRPSFNLDYLLSFPAGMARHWLFRREAVLEVGGFDPSLKEALELDLILRLVNQGGLAGLGHISEPLLITDIPALANVEDERQAIVRHLQARGYSNAQVTAAKPGRYHLEYKHAGSPVVSILIPAGAHLSRLQRCLEGVLGSTTYQAFEVLLIESHPQDQAVHEWLLALTGLQEAKLRVVQPASRNMAAMLNQAVNQASGDYLLFLAPDTAIVEEDWLDNLLNHAQRAEVGGVGGRLLTPDGKIAQAMQILGLQGPLGDPYVGEKLDEPGYMQRLQVDQNVSALSQDCLMLPRDLYVQLEGLDEEGIPLPYAMTDLCLRIREAGYLLVWSPSVQLMLDRQESTEVTAQQQDAMYAKWLPQLARDPSYNPNFSLVQPGGFKLADTQISWRPLDIWRPLPVVLAHPADTMGCGHYRVMQPFNALREAGMVDGALSVGLMHVVDLERYNPDAVILQRQIGEERLEAMRRIKAFSQAFKVYELDDYLPNLPMKSVHRQHMPKDIVKSLRRGLSYVDRFVVSTDVMAEAFAEFHPDIHVVKNRLDPRWWGGLSTGARRTSSKPRVGWAGGASHTGDLEMIVDVVKELADEVEWVFFGMCPEKLKPYIHEFHEGVAIERYAKKLASLNLDLALAPVEQNLFNECKSNLRLLEYGACGFPVICSDVRCYQDGLLPVMRVKNRFRDWMDAIWAHINDLDAAAKAGDELRAAVLAGWMLEGESLEAWRKAWLPD
ncbi:glycosyl transferase family protein [Pseudomonas sp. BAY1663]|uniref:glycosyltransferase n=1 Tax=Pseudomonas sp. BAY1663 TaxID=1439940 RepID=UPI00042E0574|nr:glycosyltransferase [Pseudomonas sp. BAY1663]EXF47096.1 glycosyl transferase family protein [Pseudomonas sp. BAY1663]